MKCQILFQAIVPVPFLQEYMEVSVVTPAWGHMVFSFVLISVILAKWLLDVALLAFPWWVIKVECLLCVYWSATYSLGKCLVVFCLFLVCLSLYYWALEIFKIRILETNSLSHIHIANISIQVCVLLFYFFNNLFWWARSLFSPWVLLTFSVTVGPLCALCSVEIFAYPLPQRCSSLLFHKCYIFSFYIPFYHSTCTIFFIALLKYNWDTLNCTYCVRSQQWHLKGVSV